MSRGVFFRMVDSFDGSTLFLGDESKYVIQQFLGSGTSGVVYEASSPEDGENVAIKILKPMGMKISSSSTVLARYQVLREGVSLNPAQLRGCLPANQARLRPLAPQFSDAAFQPPSASEACIEAISMENVCWLWQKEKGEALPAYRDENGALNELNLSQCAQVWGWSHPEECYAGKSGMKGSEGDIRLGEGGVGGYNNRSLQVPSVPSFPPKYSRFLEERNSVFREIASMVRLCTGHGAPHPNILGLLGVAEQVLDTSSRVFLILELAAGGEVFDKITVDVGAEDETMAASLFTQLLRGVQYCHDKDIVHRDLKPENLLLSTDERGQLVLKIADFSLSSLTASGTNSSGGSALKRLHSVVGSPFYVAPEVLGIQVLRDQPCSKMIQGIKDNLDGSVSTKNLKNHISNSNKKQQLSIKSNTSNPSSFSKLGYDGKLADCYSCGVIGYAFLTGSLPFDSNLQHCPRFHRFLIWARERDEILLNAQNHSNEKRLRASEIERKRGQRESHLACEDDPYGQYDCSKKTYQASESQRSTSPEDQGFVKIGASSPSPCITDVQNLHINGNGELTEGAIENHWREWRVEYPVEVEEISKHGFFRPQEASLTSFPTSPANTPPMSPSSSPNFLASQNPQSSSDCFELDGGVTESLGGMGVKHSASFSAFNRPPSTSTTCSSAVDSGTRKVRKGMRRLTNKSKNSKLYRGSSEKRGVGVDKDSIENARNLAETQSITPPPIAEAPLIPSFPEWFFPDSVSPCAASVITGLLNPFPASRLNLQQALGSAWLISHSLSTDASILPPTPSASTSLSALPDRTSSQESKDFPIPPFTEADGAACLSLHRSRSNIANDFSSPPLAPLSLQNALPPMDPLTDSLFSFSLDDPISFVGSEAQHQILSNPINIAHSLPEEGGSVNDGSSVTMRNLPNSPSYNKQ